MARLSTKQLEAMVNIPKFVGEATFIVLVVEGLVSKDADANVFQLGALGLVVWLFCMIWHVSLIGSYLPEIRGQNR